MRVVLDTEQTAVCKFIVRVTCEIVRRFFVKSDRLLGRFFTGFDKQLLRSLQELRQFMPDNFPYDLMVHHVVAMNENVAERNNLWRGTDLVRDLRVHARQTVQCFAYNLKISFNSLSADSVTGIGFESL